MDKYDFAGWATRNNLVCGDGRTIRKDAFKHCDGTTVPLIWNHQHNGPENILGHALLENRNDGVYAYCSFNDTESGKAAKLLVQHGDIASLSIYANQLQQTPNKDVMHGNIREVSLVVAGANPGARIDFVDMAHGEGAEQEAIICPYEPISLYHAEEEPTPPPKLEKKPEERKKDDEVADEPKTEKKSDKDKTVQDVVDSMTEEQKTVMYALIGAAMEQKDDSDENDDKNDKNKGGDNSMKQNVFDQDEKTENFLSHSDQADILAMAKSNSVGTLRNAIGLYMEQNEELAHGVSNIETLFPDFKDVRPGAPELVTRDQGWVNVIMKKVHKTPFARIRTRQVDDRNDTIRAHGYAKGTKKIGSGNSSAIVRTTDPQTVYRTEAINRDDILDITDFDYVEYQYNEMKLNLNEEVALAIMVGDGRPDNDPQKISEDHIRSIWNDKDVYTIHKDVDIEAAKRELQGTNTGANFGDNYVYSEAIIAASLYAREDYKGTGRPDFFCTPHLKNRMKLARDLNGRRIYTTEAELADALDVANIYTAEQFNNLVRIDDSGKKHRLLGIFVNMGDYTVGSVKGGELTRFEQFDIDFNQNKYLLETRLSGALTRVASAVVLEELVNP